MFSISFKDIDKTLGFDNKVAKATETSVENGVKFELLSSSLTGFKILSITNFFVKNPPSPPIVAPAILNANDDDGLTAKPSQRYKIQ